MNDLLTCGVAEPIPIGGPLAVLGTPGRIRTDTVTVRFSSAPLAALGTPGRIRTDTVTVRFSSAPLAALGTPGRIRTDTGWCLRPLPLPLGYRGCRRLPGKACSARANLSVRVGWPRAGGRRRGQAGADAR